MLEHRVRCNTRG
ncbi:hypothetical protein ID866_1991 [Astraeus odoratus]|nr:hypothetical protein ID866_1991 [Astraeus odoratus]